MLHATLVILGVAAVLAAAKGQPGLVLLALPRRIARSSPIYTVTAMPLSLFCSMVSTLPRRTVTDRPLPSLIWTAASDAPMSLA